MRQNPSMGRAVHFVGEDGEGYAAVVRVTYQGNPDLVDLSVFTEAGVMAVNRDEHSDAPAPVSWHWPERT